MKTRGNCCDHMIKNIKRFVFLIIFFSFQHLLGSGKIPPCLLARKSM